jgi:DNA-binding NarL/FixJ family response regulator
MAPNTPIRVFLLSGSRFLTDTLGHVSRKTADIVIIGARPYAVDALPQIIESGCDVLLADSVSMLTLDSQIHDHQRSSLLQLKVVVIELDENESTFSKLLARVYVMGFVLKEAGVADVMSAIRSAAKRETIMLPRSHMVRQLSERPGASR